MALVAVAVLDVIEQSGSLLLHGAADEVGHLLTAALILAALPRSTVRRVWTWALLGAVVIDLDHVPVYTFAPGFNADGRPPIHSLLTALVLLVLAAAVRAARVVCLGLALGVCLHFVRDIATGPGLSLCWPLHNDAVLVPYPAYLVVITAAAAIATWRIVRTARQVTAESSLPTPG